MKHETHSGGKDSARKQQERIRFYGNKVKEAEATNKQKNESDQIRK